MDKKVRIGIYFRDYNTSWIGGTYYCLNLIRALKKLDDHKRPHLIIYIDSDSQKEQILEETSYPDITIRKIQPFSLAERIANKIIRNTTKGNLLNKTFKNIDVLFLPPNGTFIKNQIAWIPDFQDRYLPEFFDKKTLTERLNHQQQIADTFRYVVFSSKDAANDFNTFLPQAKPKQYVLPFAVVHSERYKQLNIQVIREKYDIPVDYFFSPNQFWMHKNHQVVLDALRLLKKEGKYCCVVFSGKEQDDRNPDHVQNLKKYVELHQLGKYIRFLGFIDRNEQLKIMSEAIAVIQPSKFEGWSTVIEDAKATGKFVIASSLKVNKEQLNTNAIFFEPNDATYLKSILEEYSVHKPKPEILDYQQHVINYARQFMAMIEDIQEQ